MPDSELHFSEMDFASSSSATAALEKETNYSDSLIDEFIRLRGSHSDILNEILTLNNINFAELISPASETFSTEFVDTHYHVSNYCDPSITQGKHTLDVGQPDIEYLNSEFKRVARVCNWEKAKALLKEHPKQIRLSMVVGYSGETALHFAAWENQVEFVEELVNEMSEEDIAIETDTGDTAFYYAVLSEHIEAARIILKKMPDLQIDALTDAIYCESYDIAKEILSKNQRLAIRVDKKGVTALHAIAGRFSGGDEPSKSGVELMNSLLVKANGDADLVKVPLFEAAKRGNYEFLRIAQDLYPHLTAELRDENRTILDVALDHYPEILNKIQLKLPLKKTEKKKRQREIKSCEEQAPIDRAVSTLGKHRTPSSEPKKRAVSRKKTVKLPKKSIDADPELVLPSIPSELSHAARCEIPSTSSQHDEMMATNNEGLSNSPEKVKKKKNKNKKRATRLINPTSVRIAEPRKKPPSLKTLAIQNAGLHMEQLLEQLDFEAVSIFPLDVKLAFLAICRRKDLLDDDVINMFADEFIEILDISDSYVTDFGLKTVALKCPNLLALDISGCSKITKSSVELLMKKCKKLKTLRWGGTPKSDRNAASCLFLLERRLISVGKDSWEDIDLDELEGCCLATVEWLIWPGIDDEIRRELSDKYPYLVVNPEPSPGSRSTPREALAAELDEIYIEGIDPIIWTHEPEPDSSLGGDT